MQEGNKKKKYPVGNHGESTGLVDSINDGEEDNMKVLTSYARSARVQGRALHWNPHLSVNRQTGDIPLKTFLVGRG